MLLEAFKFVLFVAGAVVYLFLAQKIRSVYLEIACYFMAALYIIFAAGIWVSFRGV